MGTTAKKRLISLTMFDLIKGLAMVLVVLRHSIAWDANSEIFWKIGYSLMMPLFFVTSGYWMKKKSISAGLKTSCQYLLKPYVITVVLMDLVALAHRALTHQMDEWLQIFLIPSVLVSQYSRDGEITRIGPMWFIFALFLSWCLFYLVIQIKEEKVQIALAVLSGIAATVLLPMNLPFQIGQGCIGFFFLYAGYQIKKKKLLDKQLPVWGWAVLVILWAAAAWFGTMDLAFGDAKGGILTACGCICGVFIMIRIFLHVNLWENKLTDALKWVGRYTMWILCIHSFEKAVFPWKILFRFVDEYSIAGVIAQFVLRFIMIWIIVQIMIRMQKYMVDFGRKKD